MNSGVSRREWLALGSAAVLGGPAVVAASPSSRAVEVPGPFRYCLNTATIRGQKLPLARAVELVGQAGYHAIEPWIDELDAHVKGGGSLEALGREIRDLGLTVPSAIGFFEWCVDDDTRRNAALDEARRVMGLVRALGGQRIAAPPLGATNTTGIAPERLTERYRALLEVGETCGVVPELEVWGFSKTLGTLGEVVRVAAAADHRKACVLADIYHLYKGGSGYHGLRLLGREALPVFHVNDVPANHPRESINDSDRVYPGDGIAPLPQLFRDLLANGFAGHLSIELFNPTYYAQDPLTVLRTGLEKLRRVVSASQAAAGQ